jgi:pyrroline-5-carboxylate reductase
MAASATEPPAELRAQVTSKGGTTAAALEVFESGGLRAMVSRAVAAATQRSAELAASADRA